MRPPFASRGICQQSQAHRLLTFHRSEAHEGASGALTLAMPKADWRRRVYELRTCNAPLYLPIREGGEVGCHL